MNLLIVSAGPRAMGKTWVLSRLANAFRSALVIEQHANFSAEVGAPYPETQHITDPFIFKDGRATLYSGAQERLRGAAIVLLATDTQTAQAKIAALQQIIHAEVIWVTSMPSKVGIAELGIVVRAGRAVEEDIERTFLEMGRAVKAAQDAGLDDGEIAGILGRLGVDRKVFNLS